jgi:cell wall-associated NlpC family hydrolase
MGLNNAGTFTYTPDISCSISTISNGVIDVSADIINFQVTRNINAVSTFNATLANPRRKYNRVINTLDKITVFIKRTNFVQVFTGYVTMAPIETLVPTPIQITAACTIRNLQMTYWDDTLLAYQALLLNYMDSTASSSNATLNDGGVAQVIVNLLTKVAGWDPSRIHVAPVPQKFLEVAGTVNTNQDAYNSELNQSAVQTIASLLGSNNIVSGQSTVSTKATSSSTPPDGGVGTNFSVTRALALKTTAVNGKNKKYYPGPQGLNPLSVPAIEKDMYYCALPFSYITNPEIQIINDAKSWLATNPYSTASANDGRLLLLTNTKTNRVVALRAAAVTQKIDGNGNLFYQNGSTVADPNVNYAMCHPGVVSYLNGAIGDPTKWTTAVPADYSNIQIEWADSNVTTAGPQHAIEKAITTSSTTVVTSTGTKSSNSATAINAAITELITLLQAQLGAMYWSEGNPHDRETPNNPYTHAGGWFDCSSLMQWAYRQIGILIGGDTFTQFGTGSNADNNVCGLWVPPNQMPQPGDLLYWDVPSDGPRQPGHVTCLIRGFVNNEGVMLGATHTNHPVEEGPIYWSQIKNGGSPPGWGMTYMGARRPITLHPGWGQSSTQTITIPSTSAFADYNSTETSTLTVGNDSWNTQWLSPNYNITASTIQGTPQAFALDNPLLQDLTNVVQAGLRTYQSAPNGDFVAWFPDWYGIYGMDPVMEICDVEIIDFQIYHNDDALVTHVAVIGDTTGIGQAVSAVDYMVTQGIVSIQDPSIMQLLFGAPTGSTATDEQNATTVMNFLQRYGIRPLPQEINFIHAHSLEYFFALQTFMQQWANQYTSNVTLTFMPELYPGMRVVINVDSENGGFDEYQFYCVGVTHYGDRNSGFTTQAQLTAPVKNGTVMSYGLDLV